MLVFPNTVEDSRKSVQNMTSKRTITELPPNMIEKIYEYLSPEELQYLSESCTFFQDYLEHTSAVIRLFPIVNCIENSFREK